MAVFNSNGVRIHFLDEGKGDPVMLVHGFASNAENNWVTTGWLKFLTPHYRVLALDCRGHGKSDKPHEAAEYTIEKMTGDVTGLLDHLGIRRAFLMGYSMGGRISMGLMTMHPDRFRAIVLGGVGWGVTSAVGNSDRRNAIVNALLADDPKSIKEETPRLFRAFAESNHNDLHALAACMGSHRPELDNDEFAAVKLPVLIVIGTKDTTVGSAEPIQKMIPGSRLVTLEGRDHLNAPGDRHYKEVVLEFFRSAPN